MARIRSFTFRLNADERKLLALLARRLERSQSDALRFLLRKAGKEMEAQGQGLEDQTATSGLQDARDGNEANKTSEDCRRDA